MGQGSPADLGKCQYTTGSLLAMASLEITNLGPGITPRVQPLLQNRTNDE